MSIFVSKSFKYIEFICPCGCGKTKPIDSRFIYLLQNLRDKLNQPIYITKGGGIRCPSYNKKIGGYFNSAHLFGRAGDIRVVGMDIVSLAKQAKDIGFPRIGLYPYDNFVHLDVMRPFPSEAWLRGKSGRYYYYRKFEEAIESVSKW